MKKILVSFSLFILLFSSAKSQSVKYIIPDSGYQGTSFPITIIGDATEWLVSNYFTIFFDSTDVTGYFNTVISDTMITGTVNIGGKAATIPRGIYVLDKFANPYTKDSALKVLLSIPVTPTLILPPNNSTNQFQFVTLLWDSNASASSFRVQLSTDEAFLNIIFDSSVANTPLQMRPDFLQLSTKYFWRVNAANIIGTSSWSSIWNFTVRSIGINLISSEIPGSFKLMNNYPNPFNPVTRIRFQIPKTGFVEIKVFDITGKNISTLINQTLKEGTYESIFDASSLPSGIYIVKMQAGNYSGINKIVLIK